MRISPIVLLLFAVLGCGSGTKSAKPSAESGGNQSQPPKVATPEKQAASPAEKTPIEKAPAEKTPAVAPKPPNVVPNSPKAKAAIEAAIRKAVGKPTGELTKADVEKVTRLDLEGNQITDLKPLAGLTKLELLYLSGNPNLTKAEIDKLQKALPKCEIKHNATK